MTAASDPNTADDDLLVLLGGDVAVRRAVAQRATLSEPVLEALLRDRAPAVRAAVAKRKAVSPEALTALADDPDEKVRAAVAANRLTPERVVLSLVRDTAAAVRDKARANKGLAPAAKKAAASLTDAEVLRGHLHARAEETRRRAAAFRTLVAAASPEGEALPAALRQTLADCVARAPDVGAWKALADALEGARVKEPALAAAFAFLEPRLTAWPSALRVTDDRQVRRLDRDGDDPRLGLARRLVVTAGPLVAPFGEDFVVKLAACPWLAGCEALSLRGLPLRRLGLEVLLASPFRGALRGIDLGDTGLGPAGAAMLAGDAGLAGLEHLALDRNGIDGPGFEALGEACFAPSLRTLDLRSSRVTGGVGHLGRAAGAWRRFERLESLLLAFNGLGDGVARLLGSAQLAHLRELDLQACDLGDDSARALADSPWLGRLERLELTANFFSVEGIRAIVRSPNLPSLRAIDVSNAVPHAQAGETRDLLRALTARGCEVRFDMVR